MDAPPGADRILVVRLGAVGDVVRTLPAATALRAAYPEAELSWLVEPASVSVVEGQPWVDRVVVYPRAELVSALLRVRLVRAARLLRDFLGLLRAGRYDLVMDFHSILKSAVLARLTGCPMRVGYAPPYGREASWLLASRRVRVAPSVAPRFARNAALVEFLGVHASPAARPLHAPGWQRCSRSRALRST